MTTKLSELAKRLGDVDITIWEYETNIEVRLDNSMRVMCCPKGNGTVAELLLSLIAKCYQEAKKGDDK